MSQSFENLSEAEVVKLAQEGDAAAEEYIINKYKNLVRSQARAYYLMGAEAEDLLQEGMIGLFKAVRDYDENRCSTFFAFAQLCIRRQLISALKGATRQKHIPLNSYVSLNKPIYDDESDRTLLDVLTGQGVTDPERLMISKEDYRLIGDKIENLLSPFEKGCWIYILTG